ncbi:adhesion G-protein coupled receptor G6 isoform X2 [Micropterus dolomieu]|uniref:adhesion G-protein coupled receptor G6 isoform X2 n=1 Tax=Micropterus dolomieu TaxID=147949 RepID=UPI001E8D12AE|nr:adhesion G-protein coupled receptor G6 isoform X2 [Micropterus dolomieu]
MESSTAGGGGGGGGGRWRLRHVVPVVLLWMSLLGHVLGCIPTNCNMELTESKGEFTSPCYPQVYPNSQACRWTMRAPAGFIIQLSFLHFELEEAPGCIYDRVVVNTGKTDVRFCGLTANGLTLNSTGDVMELSFTSDFSVQKRGFRVSFQHVAVALRNQKVSISSGKGQITRVASSISIPTLSQLTVCFELQRSSQKQKESIFTYYDINNNVALSLGSDVSGTKMDVGGVDCSIESIMSTTVFTSTMKPFCVLWTSSNGRVAVYFNNEFWAKTCASSTGLSVAAGGVFQLGGQQSLTGNIYNFRLWDYAMTEQQLRALTCDTVGNVIDWDNSYWTIPSTLAQMDATLNCSVSPSISTPVPLTVSCNPSGLGCPATSSPTASSTDSTNNINATNASTYVLSTITPSTSTSTISTTSMPLTPTISTTTTTSTTSSSSSVVPATTITITASAATPASHATNVASASSTAHAPQTTSSTSTVSSATTNQPATNPTTHERQFYRISFVVDDRGATLTLADVEQAAALWLNQTFQNWNYAVYIDSISVQPDLPSRGNLESYTCQALLVYPYGNRSLSEAAVSATLSSREGLMGAGLQIQPDSTNVRLIANCPGESLVHYNWPQTRPTITQYLPCFPNKDQMASRTCSISAQNYSSFWSTPDSSKCTNIATIPVTAENAADVAQQLVNITDNELSNEEVSKVVAKVNQLVNVAKINTTLASTVVKIISNVMTSSETALSNTSKEALKTVDELVEKLEFDGPSVSITSKHLALGISALNGSTFNGTTFSAFLAPDSTNPQIEFQSERVNPLSQITLPRSLLSSGSLSDADRSSLYRINFMFFRSTNLFQKKQGSGSLNSYVVASSVQNVSISNLQQPVKIEIAHLDTNIEQQYLNPVCMFWDFSMNNGAGGWNGTGCRVSNESTRNRTICLCDHLTHFGILMDFSGASLHIDAQNNKILTFITYIGCGISAIFSAVTLVTYIAFEKLRRDYPSKILMNLSTSLLFLNMVFLLDGWLTSRGMDWLCKCVAALLHYFLLTSFTWMGLESIHMYIALVKVFNTYIRRYILKFCIVGWGLPAVMVGIVVAVDRDIYGPGKPTNGSSEFCWIQNESVLYTTCVGYFCLVFLLNVAMFIVVMRQICGRNGKRSNRTLKEEVLRNLRSVVSLTFLLGMTWGFALFAWGSFSLVFTYLFSIFNSLQGLFIFIFHCALKENVQKQWRRYLCYGRFRLSDNSDWSKTATNNTKKVSSDNLGKSLSSGSFSSSTANWTSKAKATLSPITKRNSNTDKGYSNQPSPKCVSSCPSSSEEGPSSSSSSSSMLPVSQMIDKVKGYCSTRSDNFYKNIIMSESFANCTRL